MCFSKAAKSFKYEKSKMVRPHKLEKFPNKSSIVNEAIRTIFVYFFFQEIFLQHENIKQAKPK